MENRRHQKKHDSDKTDEPTLSRFNLAAFLAPSSWCVLNKQWKLSLLCIPKILFILFAANFIWFSYEIVITVLICIFVYSLFQSIYISIIADAIEWKSGKHPNIKHFNKSKKSDVVAFSLILIVWLVFTASIMPEIYRPRDKSRYTACMEQLAHIKTGVESYLTENDSLKGVSVPDDICHHILPGFEEASQCRGMVQERIDSVCLPKSFSFKVKKGFDYEIRGQAQDKNHCKICVTEVTATPPKYDECSKDMKFNCVHNK